MRWKSVDIVKQVLLTGEQKSNAIERIKYMQFDLWFKQVHVL